MRSEQQHIDDFIRNKTDEFHPDQQGLQPNWQQMQKMLVKPGPKFKITKSSKLIKYVGGIAVVTIITITAIQFNNKKKAVATKKAEVKSEFVANKPVSEQKINTVKKSAIDHKANTVVVANPKVENKIQHSNKARKTFKPDVAKSVTVKPRKRISDDQVTQVMATRKPATKEVKADGPDPLLILERFYAELEKTPEEFFIRADRDTVLKAKEGTRLTIPSNGFDKKTGTIKIILTEFYSDEDMITGKLSTTSGDRQLITGGMLNIRAEADGTPVKISPEKKIVVEMPTKNFDDKMQLFTGSTNGPNMSSILKYDYPRDTVAYVISGKTSNRIEWTPAGQEQSLMDAYAPRVFKVPDIAGEPFKVKYTDKKVIATYLISRDVKMSNREVKEKLRRYSLYYDVIKVRRLMFGPNFPRLRQDLNIIQGDSIEMKFESALRLKLVSKEDSARYRQLIQKDSLQRENRRKYLSNYKFEIKDLGWINCDRFNPNQGPLTEFTLNLGEGAEPGNFITQLIFTNYRSMMRGQFVDDKIRFRNVPLNEPVYLVTVGVVNGKVLSCVKPMNTRPGEINDLALEETNTEQFRAKVTELVKSIPR